MKLLGDSLQSDNYERFEVLNYCRTTNFLALHCHFLITLFVLQLDFLTEHTYSHTNERAGLSNPTHPGTGSVYYSENSQLKLSPPPLVEEQLCPLLQILINHFHVCVNLLFVFIILYFCAFICHHINPVNSIKSVKMNKSCTNAKQSAVI